MKKKDAVERAAALGINLTVGTKPAGKTKFPEKLAKANEILSKLKTPLPSHKITT